MRVAANIFLAFIFISGLYVQFSQSWNVVYRVNILFHPIFSFFATLWLLNYYNRHAHDKSGAGPAESMYVISGTSKASKAASLRTSTNATVVSWRPR